MEQIFVEPDSRFESDGDVSLKQKWSPISVSGVPESDSGYLECNICLESAQDPVVTLCGHLYCWPCIYRWLHVQTSTDADQQQQNCPVCKSNIAITSLVPLYGRGMSSSEFESKKYDLGMIIPHRPHPFGLNNLITSTSASNLRQSERLHQIFSHPQSQSFHHQQYFSHPHGGYPAMTSNSLGGSAMESFFNPTIGMFGEMVYARIFGSEDTSLFAYPYQTPYHFMDSNSPVTRRQEMQFFKPLNRVSIFLFCCIILCLFLF